jgi:rubrerythrin
MEKKLTPDELVVLDTCEKIELVFAELYHYLANTFADDSEIAELWSRTAADEEHHAYQFALAKKIKIGLVDSLKVDRWKAENTLNIVHSVLKSVQEHPPKLEDALRSAIKLEETLSHFHMDCIAFFNDESSQKMFHAMMAADDGHITRLKDTYNLLIQSKKHA